MNNAIGEVEGGAFSSHRLSLHDSIHLTRKDDWQAVAQSAPIYLSFEHLAALEDQMAGHMEFRYAMFYCAQFKPVGIAYFQSVDFLDNGSEYVESVSSFAKSLSSRVLKEMRVRCLVSGNIYHTGRYGFFFLNDLALSTQINIVESTMKRIMAGKRLEPRPSVSLFKEFDASIRPVADQLLDRKYHHLNLDVDMVLTLESHWKSIADYCADLKAKSRNRFNNILVRSSAIEIRSLEASEIANHALRIKELFQEVIEQAPYSFEVLDTAVYSKWKAAHKENMAFHGFFLENELIGFNVVFVVGNNAEAHYVGFDYEHNKELLIYQRMLIDVLAFAIERNLNAIHFGRTAEQAKSTFGAKPKNLMLYLKHRNSIANRIIEPFIGSIEPSEFEMRNPFKAAQTS